MRSRTEETVPEKVNCLGNRIGQGGITLRMVKMFILHIASEPIVCTQQENKNFLIPQTHKSNPPQNKSEKPFKRKSAGGGNE